jgi:hypothetical protein
MSLYNVSLRHIEYGLYGHAPKSKGMSHLCGT